MSLSPLFSPQEREYCARPRLDIIQPLAETCEEISSDALTVRGFQENECRDYHLGERDQGSGSCFVLHLGFFPFHSSSTARNKTEVLKGS